jgi:hypothetical protein
LACENASLSHAGRFGDKATHDQVAKTQGDIAPHKTSTSKLPTSTPRASIAQKGTYVASTSIEPPVDQKANVKRKGTVAEEDNKNVRADPNDPNKKLQISSNLDPK